MDRDLR